MNESASRRNDFDYLGNHLDIASIGVSHHDRFELRVDGRERDADGFALP